MCQKTRFFEDPKTFSIRLRCLFVAALPRNHVSNTRSQEASVPGADTIRVILQKIRTNGQTDTQKLQWGQQLSGLRQKLVDTFLPL